MFQLVSTTTPNSPAEVISKNNLEESIIQNAPFAFGFLEFILGFQKYLNAPLGVLFIGIIPYELLRKHLNM